MYKLPMLHLSLSYFRTENKTAMRSLICASYFCMEILCTLLFYFCMDTLTLICVLHVARVPDLMILRSNF